MRKTLETRKKEYRTIYELLRGKPRTSTKNVASFLESDRRSASNRLKEAFSLGYVLKPRVEKRSYQNLKEHVYFLQHRNPLEAFEAYKDLEGVRFCAVLGGPATFWMITTEDLEAQNTMVKGLRSDYHVAFAPEIGWDDALRVIHKKIEAFKPEYYLPRRMIQTHWNKLTEWDEEDEKLFCAFQHDLTKKLNPIMKENLISGQKIYEWFKRLNETCTVYTQFFPEGISAYEPYVFAMETDYEDFVIDVFSQFPTSPLFFRTGQTLFCSSHVKSGYMKKTAGPMERVEELGIPFILKTLQKKGYISRWWYSSVEFWSV